MFNRSVMRKVFGVVIRLAVVFLIFYVLYPGHNILKNLNYEFETHHEVHNISPTKWLSLPPKTVLNSREGDADVVYHSYITKDDIYAFYNENCLIIDEKEDDGSIYLDVQHEGHIYELKIFNRKDNQIIHIVLIE